MFAVPMAGYLEGSYAQIYENVVLCHSVYVTRDWAALLWLACGLWAGWQARGSGIGYNGGCTEGLVAMRGYRDVGSAHARDAEIP